MSHGHHDISNYRQSWWSHQMETFSALLVLCEGNPPVTVGFPSQGQCRGTLIFSLICAWTNGREMPYRPLWRHCKDQVTSLYWIPPLQSPSLQDFARIMAAVERGSCQSVDEYTTDLLLGGSDEAGGGDLYQKVAQFDRPIFPFGKAVTKSRGEIRWNKFVFPSFLSTVNRWVNAKKT